MSRYNAAYIVEGTSAVKPRYDRRQSRSIEVTCTRGERRNRPQQNTEVRGSISYGYYTLECIDEIKQGANLREASGVGVNTFNPIMMTVAGAISFTFTLLMFLV